MWRKIWRIYNLAFLYGIVMCTYNTCAWNNINLDGLSPCTCTYKVHVHCTTSISAFIANMHLLLYRLSFPMQNLIVSLCMYNVHIHAVYTMVLYNICLHMHMHVHVRVHASLNSWLCVISHTELRCFVTIIIELHVYMYISSLGRFLWCGCGRGLKGFHLRSYMSFQAPPKPHLPVMPLVLFGENPVGHNSVTTCIQVYVLSY